MALKTICVIRKSAAVLCVLLCYLTAVTLTAKAFTILVHHIEHVAHSLLVIAISFCGIMSSFLLSIRVLAFASTALKNLRDSYAIITFTTLTVASLLFLTSVYRLTYPS
jgi:hypothetical protein